MERFALSVAMTGKFVGVSKVRDDMKLILMMAAIFYGCAIGAFGAMALLFKLAGVL